MFEEEGTYYTSHLWVTGIDNVAFECSFTVPKGEHVDEAEKIISSLEIRKDGQKYPAEIIPIRLSEIYQVNEAYRVGDRYGENAIEKRLSGTGRRPAKDTGCD